MSEIEETTDQKHPALAFLIGFVIAAVIETAGFFLVLWLVEHYDWAWRLLFYIALTQLIYMMPPLVYFSWKKKRRAFILGYCTPIIIVAIWTVSVAIMAFVVEMIMND